MISELLHPGLAAIGQATYRIWSSISSRCVPRIAVAGLMSVVFWTELTSVRADVQQVVFTIDSSQSSMTWGGSLNGSTFQQQAAGSLVAPLSGHFVVSFDPLNSAPADIQFVPTGGFYAAGNTGNWIPDDSGNTAVSEPANFGGITANGLTVAVRDLDWDFFTDTPISPTSSTASSSSYDAAQTSFNVLSGGMVGYIPFFGPQALDFTGSVDHLTSGSWTMTETSPGNWSLDLTRRLQYHAFGFGFVAHPVPLHDRSLDRALRSAEYRPCGSDGYDDFRARRLDDHWRRGR